MWPFRKKISLQSTMMSGFVACDGKHHLFSTWKDIELQGTVWRIGMSKPMTYSTDAQERTCVICHYKERRDIRGN